MTRAERLRAALAGTNLEDRAEELATLPAAQVDLIVRALKASHRAGRDHEAAVKRQRKADARKHGHHRDAIPGRNLRLVEKQGQVAASGDLFYLEGLAGIRRGTDDMIAHAVEGCRAQGLSDALIGDALGITRQAVGQRFGRKHAFTPGSPGRDGAA